MRPEVQAIPRSITPLIAQAVSPVAAHAAMATQAYSGPVHSFAEINAATSAITPMSTATPVSGAVHVSALGGLAGISGTGANGGSYAGGRKYVNKTNHAIEQVLDYANQLYLTYTGKPADPASFNYVVQSILGNCAVCLRACSLSLHADKSFSLAQAEFHVKFSKEGRAYQAEQATRNKVAQERKAMLAEYGSPFALRKCSLIVQ